PDDEQLSPRWAPPRLPTPEPPALPPRGTDDFPWDDYIDFHESPPHGSSASGSSDDYVGRPQFRAATIDYILPQ
ncbi:hypothetical protein BGZ89_007461, partial [Linnemannia elongata]